MSTPNKSKGKNTPKKRIIEFQDKHLYVKNNELWCRPCNVKIDFDKKSSVKQHLETKTHLNLINLVKSNKKPNFQKEDRNEIKKQFSKDLMTGFASANIPVHKLENKVLKNILSKYLKDEVADAWPSSTTVRKTLPDIHDSEFNYLKDSLKGKKIAVFADETTDCEQRYVLNILILELDFFKGHKPLSVEFCE